MKQLTMGRRHSQKTKLSPAKSPAAATPLVKPSARRVSGPAKVTKQATPKDPGRIGRCQIAGHFPRALRRQLKHLEASTGRTLQDLLGEAIHDFLAKKATAKRSGR